MRLNFYNIDNVYNEYLRTFDSKVQDTSFTNKKNARPFIGILININGIDYVAPLASPKEKHKNMKNRQDFIKINNGLWGAINFNNMIPVNASLISKINMDILTTDEPQTRQYKELLRNQLTWCNSHSEKIIKTSNKLYSMIINNKCSPNLKQRCCNFKLLEQKLSEYLIMQGITKPQDKKEHSTKSPVQKKNSKAMSFLDRAIARASKKADELNNKSQPENTKTKSNKINLD